MPCIHETAVIAEDAVIILVFQLVLIVLLGRVSSLDRDNYKKQRCHFRGVRIGKFCYLKSGSIIGEDGFGFDFENDKTPVRLPHLGSVEIGDYVEVGSNAVISRGR